jgi:hypothetical protein
VLHPGDGEIEAHLLHARAEGRVVRLREVAQREPGGRALGHRIEVVDDAEQGQQRRGIGLAEPRGQDVEDGAPSATSPSTSIARSRRPEAVPVAPRPKVSSGDVAGRVA